ASGQRSGQRTAPATFYIEKGGNNMLRTILARGVVVTGAAMAAIIGTAVAASAAQPAGPVVSAQAASAKLPVITTFTRNHFPESLAIDGQGNLYASLDYIGQVVQVTPGGQQHLVASFDVGAGFLTGLAFDPSGNLYVADATFEASPTPPGVFRIGAGGAVTRVAALPTFSFPNGLAFHDGSLYISDSSLGVIWRLPPGGNPTVWLKDPLLAPKTTRS